LENIINNFTEQIFHSLTFRDLWQLLLDLENSMIYMRTIKFNLYKYPGMKIMPSYAEAERKRLS
jgi:hypothetical protein